MITARATTQAPVELAATIERAPSVYLDSDSLFDIAQSAERSRSFAAAFETCGTLMLSWANVLEISLRSGRGAEQVQALA